MITKPDREKAILRNKDVIIDFLLRNWERLATDQAISEKADDEDSDVRRIVKNFIEQTPNGSIDITFSFNIFTKPYSSTELEEL